MATIDPTATIKRKRAILLTLGVVFLVGIAVWVFAMRRSPQMGTDEQVFRTVDALYTAVCSHDEKRLTDCEQRLQSYREAGRLPADAADYLDGIIARARSGAWTSSAEKLYDFMLAQQREGADATHTPRPDQKTKSSKGKS